MRSNFQSIDEYIKTFPSDIQVSLQKIRQTIKKAAPEAQEAISYQIPTFKLHGNLVHFAAFKKHIGFYPGSEAINYFANELSSFEQSKGTIKFPLDRPVPYSLINKIVEHRVKVNLEKAGDPKRKKQKD